MRRFILCTTLTLGLFSVQGLAQEKKKTPPVRTIAPTAAALPYGKHERQVLDVWKAKSEKPTPLVLYSTPG